MANEVRVEAKSMPVACLAPALTDEKLSKYNSLFDGAEAGPVKDAAMKLLACVSAWWALPDSKRTDGNRLKFFHKSEEEQERTERTVELVPLEKEHQKSLYDLIPWDYELVALDTLFDTIPNDTQKELRDAAFHLLWFVKELNLDREPLTADKL